MRAEALVAVRLLLQHHPLCHWFAGDRLRVAGVAVCSGCLAAAPAATLGLAAGIVAAVWRTELAPAFVAGGLLLGLPQLTTYLHRGGRAWRFAAKAIGGLGLGVALGAALFLPVPDAWLLAAAGTLAIAFAGLQALRVRSILAKCDACPYRRDWDACPGFRATPGPLPPPGGHQPRPKPLKGASDTSSRNAGPAHRG